MKSAKSGRGSPKTVDEYLARVPEPARATLNKMPAIIRSAVPKETTEVLSYGIPTFCYKRMVVAVAAFKDHCSFFPLGSSVLDLFAEEIKDYRVTKGTLQFPVDQPMPGALVKKIVNARIAQNERKKATKSSGFSARHAEP